jgi:hypothetical protein
VVVLCKPESKLFLVVYQVHRFIVLIFMPYHIILLGIISLNLSHPRAPTDRSRLHRCPMSGVDMRTGGNVRLVSICNRHALAHDSRRQYGILLMLSEHTYPGHDLHAWLLCLPTIPPATTYFPSLAARLPALRAGALHASQEAHSIMDTSTLFHFWCTTQLSNAPRAEFSVYRNLDGYEATEGAYMDLDDVSF